MDGPDSLTLKVVLQALPGVVPVLLGSIKLGTACGSKDVDACACLFLQGQMGTPAWEGFTKSVYITYNII